MKKGSHYASEKHPLYGKHHSEKTKKKMSEAKIGIHRSEETKRKIGQAHKGMHRSEETKRKISEAHMGIHYSKETRKKLSEARIGKYVGEKHPNWKGGKTKIICTLCGKEAFAKPSHIKRGYGKFCSKKCGAIDRMKHQKKHDTDIERLIENELKNQNIPYLKQAPIEGIALVDFLLSNKIIIQADGNFWHSRKINKGKDIAQDTVLFFKGYKVFRLTETEIKKSVKKCINKIVLFNKKEII